MHHRALERIQRAKWFVHQQHRRLQHQRPGNGHPLLHAAGQLVHRPRRHLSKPNQRQHFIRHRQPFGLPHALEAQSQRDILPRVQPWQQRIILEHHCPVRPGPDHRPAADGDRAHIGPIEAGDDVQQRGLAATGRTDQHHQFAGPDIQVDVLQDPGLAARRIGKVPPDMAAMDDAVTRHGCSFPGASAAARIAASGSPGRTGIPSPPT